MNNWRKFLLINRALRKSSSKDAVQCFWSKLRRIYQIGRIGLNGDLDVFNPYYGMWESALGLFKFPTCGHLKLSYGSATLSCCQYSGVSLDLLGCRNCGECAKCCPCKPCTRCGQRSNLCSSCGRCDLCEDCVFCRRCRTRVGSRLEHTLHTCGRCPTCCICARYVQRVGQPKPPVFHESRKLQHRINTSRRFLSVEIEVAEVKTGAKLPDVIAKWAAGIVTDGSLPELGFEINTAPANGDLFVQQVREVCAALGEAGASVSEECGLHVHVDARDFSYYELRNLLQVYSLIEPALFEMVPRRRRESRYCKPCGDLYLDALPKHPRNLTYKNVKSAIISSVYESDRPNRKEKYCDARYNALNIHSWFFRGTVESRLFAGSTNAEKIIAWATMWAKIVDYAQSRSINSLAVKTSAARERTGNSRVCYGMDFLLNEILRGSPQLQDFALKRLLGFTKSGFIRSQFAATAANAIVPVPLTTSDANNLSEEHF